ncbi:MAG: ABC transporter ATP-binding protein [Candidatus Sabulitectum sp.]|nr:ABC transporter ATP-binding protein [Candidatus Sabulitectum sp.]
MADAHPLQVKDLSKQFARKRRLGSVQAISSISFDVRQGEIVGFIGHNGAGKTTTIKCVLGLLKPSEGGVSLWGSLPAAPVVRKRIGYIPENPDYDDSFNPMEYLNMFASMRGLSGLNSDWMKLLRRVGLAGWESTGIRQFSKGMRQRMSLAIALQSRPDLLIMDEPTGGLDPIARKEFREIILEENSRGASVLLSSHILSDVETICSRAIILSRGRLIAEGSMDDLLGQEHLFRITVISRKTGKEVEEIITEADLQTRIDSMRQDNLTIVKIERALKSLEDVFMAATGGSVK